MNIRYFVVDKGLTDNEKLKVLDESYRLDDYWESKKELSACLQRFQIKNVEIVTAEITFKLK